MFILVNIRKEKLKLIEKIRENDLFEFKLDKGHEVNVRYIIGKDTIIFKRTNDWWCGNFIKDEVKVMYRGNLNSSRPHENPCYRIIVSGTDDTMMNFDTESEFRVKMMFEKLCQMDFIDYEDLDIMGFEMF